MNNKIIRPLCIVAVCFCFVFCGFVSLLAELPAKKNLAGPVDSVFEVKKGGHTARLSIRTSPFRREAHKVECKKWPYLVDGKIALGTDGGLPAIEIERMELAFDGKTITIPARLYGDVFEPSLNKGYFAIRFGDDLDSLFVFMSGSDGSGSYQLVWVFRRDGRHSRFSVWCPDCQFLDFQSGLLRVTENE